MGIVLKWLFRLQSGSLYEFPGFGNIDIGQIASCPTSTVIKQEASLSDGVCAGFGTWRRY